MPTEPPLLLDLAPPPDAAPAGPPPDFRPEAEDAFVDMIRAAGKTAYLMPTSCALYVRQYLGPFEPEREAVAEALRRGVPERIAKHPGGKGYREYLMEEAGKLAADAELKPGVAWGAVECWAAGVGKPLGGPPAPTPTARSAGISGPKNPKPNHPLHLVMALICAAGGFLGGFVGNSVPAFIGVTVIDFGAVEEIPDPAGKPGGFQLIEFVNVNLNIVLIGMLMGGASGAVGAGSGWLMGRGDQRPWAGFAAAAVTAAGTAGVVSAIRGASPVSSLFIVATTFGATYRVAASGGYRR